MLVKLALFGVVIWLVGRALVRSLSGVQWEQVHLHWGFLATAWAIRLGQMAVAVTALRMLLCRMCRGHETSPGASGPHVPPSWPVMFGIITVSSIGIFGTCPVAQVSDMLAPRSY